MIIRGKQISVKQMFCLMFYYGVCRYLPVSYNILLGGGSKEAKIFLLQKYLQKVWT